MFARRCYPMLAAGALLAGCLAAPAVAAQEHTRIEPLWLEPAHPEDAMGPVGYTVPALLNIRPDWVTGDAAAIVLSDGPWAEPVRDRLVAALLEAGAAVLELDVNTARGFAPDNGATGPAPSGRDLLPDVFAALQSLRRDAGAGLVVAIGQGAGGEAALLAAPEAVAARHLGAAGPRLAAAAALKPGAARFAAGPPPSANEGWPVRAGPLCDVLRAVTIAPRNGFVRQCVSTFLGLGAAGAEFQWAQAP